MRSPGFLVSCRAVLTVGTLAMIACGGGDLVSNPPPGPPPPPPPPPAPPVLFDSPIEGVSGASHWYGALVDRGGRDYLCGVKYYSGHRGIDILLRNFEVQDSGVKVVAAAPGTVIFTRQDLPDRNTVNGNGGFGNHVIVDHGGGILTTYGHLRANSLLVTLNAVVEAGQPLGQVGSSGNSNWPHLHFEVTDNNSAREPFNGSCNQIASMWRSQLPYQNAFAVVDAGLTLGAVSFADLLEGPPRTTQVPAGINSAVAWYNLANVQSDSVRFAMKDAGGVQVTGLTIGRAATFSNTFIGWRFPVAGVLVTPGAYTIEMWQRSPPGGPLFLADTQTFILVAGAPVPPGANAQISTMPTTGKVEIWSAGKDQLPVPQ